MIDPTTGFERLIAARAHGRGIRLSAQEVIEILARVEALQGELTDIHVEHIIFVNKMEIYQDKALAELEKIKSQLGINGHDIFTI